MRKNIHPKVSGQKPKLICKRSKLLFLLLVAENYFRQTDKRTGELRQTNSVPEPP